MQLKGRVHLGGDFINAGVENISVDVHGSGKLCVAEEFLSKLEVYARLIECGRVAVADLMRGDGDAGALAVGVKLIGDVPAGERAFSAIVGKDIAVLFLREYSSQRGKQRNRADTGGGLRLFDLWHRASMVDTAADVDPALFPVDVFVAQALGLAAAAAGIINQEGKQAKVVSYVVLNLLNLICGRRVTALLREIFREKDGLRSVKGDVPFTLGFVQDLPDDLALGDNGLLCVGFSKLIDVRLDFLARDRRNVFGAELRDSALIGRGIVAKRIRGKRWLNFAPPGMGNGFKGGSFRLLGFGAVSLNLIPYLPVCFAAECLALAIDSDNRFMQAVWPDVVFGDWHRKTSKDTAPADRAGAVIFYPRNQPTLGFSRSTAKSVKMKATATQNAIKMTRFSRASLSARRFACSMQIS